MGWVKQVLKNSGVGISQLHNSFIKVGHLGLSVEDILRKGNWSNKSTWQRFYNKKDTNKFDGTLLRNAGTF